MEEIATNILELYEIKWAIEDKLEVAKKDLIIYEKYNYVESITWQRKKVQRIKNVLNRVIAAIDEIEEGK